MIMAAVNPSFQLEMAFREPTDDEVCVCKDSITIDPQEAISKGLKNLYTKGYLTKETVNRMLEEYNFEGMSIREIVEDDYYAEKMLELVNELKVLNKKRSRY